MGTLTRVQMESETKFRLGGRTAFDAQITTAVQFAYDELVTSIRIPENQESAILSLETTTVKTIYATPLDLFAPVSLRNQTEGERMEPWTIREYDKVKDTMTRAKPKFYIWWRNELIIHPPNDATARSVLMRYIKRLPNLATSATVTALAREWDEVVIQGALFRMLKWLGLHQEAQAEMGEYVSMISRRLDRLGEGAFDRQSSATPILPARTADTGWRS